MELYGEGPRLWLRGVVYICGVICSSPAANQSSSQQELDAKQESSKTSVSGKSSRTGRESKAYVSNISVRNSLPL